jgi:hypothetical protein
MVIGASHTAATSHDRRARWATVAPASNRSHTTMPTMANGQNPAGGTDKAMHPPAATQVAPVRAQAPARAPRCAFGGKEMGADGEATGDHHARADHLGAVGDAP